MHRFSPPLYIVKHRAIPPTNPDRQRALDEALAALGRDASWVLPAGATIEMIAPSLRSFAARTGLGWTGEPYLRLAGVETRPRPGLDRPTVYELMTEQLRKRDLRLLSGAAS